MLRRLSRGLGRCREELLGEPRLRLRRPPHGRLARPLTERTRKTKGGVSRGALAQCRRMWALVMAAALATAACAASQPEFPNEPSQGSLFRALHVPPGRGPFPAVVVLHTCAGVGSHLAQWVQAFGAAGYAAAVVDSFTPRGVRSVCGNWAVSVDQVTMDAFAALRRLRDRREIDRDRIGVIGFSYGAMAALRTASTRYGRSAGVPGFRAVVSVYPVCISPRSNWPASTQERLTNLYGDVETPTLILIGGADTDTPNVAANCEAAVARLRADRRPVDIKIYRGAGHGFDQSWNLDTPATDDAIKTTLTFYRRNLNPE